MKDKKLEEQQNIKLEIYRIFNQIQTDTNTKENLSALITLFEKRRIDSFIVGISNIVNMTFMQYDKNFSPLKNIIDFLKRFLDKICKIQKVQREIIVFIEYFCNLFCQNAKKNEHRELCFMFLGK
jgi:hypothetical protein